MRRRLGPVFGPSSGADERVVASGPSAMMCGMDDAVRGYIEAIAPEHRPLFDRLHRLILEAHLVSGALDA